MKKLIFTLIFPTLLFSFHDHDEKEHIHENEKTFFDHSLDVAEDKFHYLYEKVNLSSKYIDEFLTQEEDDKKYYNSYIRIETSIRKQESDDTDYEADVDLKIDLPKLKRKISLTFDNKEQRRDEGFEDSNENVPFRDNDYNLGLAYETLKKDINLKIKAGVKSGSKLYPFIKAKAKKEFNLTEKNILELQQEFKYSEQNELESDSSLKYDYLLKGKDLIISSHNEYYINDKENVNNVYNSIRLYQHIKGRNYINYVLAVSSNDNNSNFKVKNYRAYLSYRHYIRKWLYYDVIPMNTINAVENSDRYSLEFKLGILIRK